MSVLDSAVLSLNKSWQPINIINVRHAIKLVIKETAQFICPKTYQLFTWEDWSAIHPSNEDSYIQAVNRRYLLPEVLLLNYNKLPGNNVTFSRNNIYKRDRYTCSYCGCQPIKEELTIDHVIPKSRQGGESTWKNCVLACMDCNFKKADRTPEEAGMKLRIIPTKPAWKPIYNKHLSTNKSWKSFISNSYWDIELES